MESGGGGAGRGGAGQAEGTAQVLCRERARGGASGEVRRGGLYGKTRSVSKAFAHLAELGDI